jgi:hypothetical protein
MGEDNDRDLKRALSSYGSIKLSTGLLLFYANPSNVTMSGCCLIKRVKRATEISTLESKQNIQQLAGTLGDNPQSWWDCLAAFEVNRSKWDAVKAHFLK